jgi:hypothetical protein
LYQWKKDNENYGTQTTSSSISVSEAGVYSVEMIYKLTFSGAVQINNIDTEEISVTTNSLNNVDNFTEIGIVKGGGNSKITLDYAYSDKNFTGSIACYRLKQVDYDGTSKTYKILSANCQSTQLADVKIYPNPFKENINIKITNADSEEINVRIYDISGRIIYSGKYKFNSFVLSVSTLLNHHCIDG